MAISLQERILGPMLFGGSVWLYGIFQQQGSGYRIFVRYSAAFAFGLGVLIATLDLLPQWMSHDWPLIAIAWAVLIGWIGWIRHLK
jgi:hypothetical protein